MTQKLDHTKNYHFIGIGGIGMSALARILLEKKMSVSGSDLKRSSLVERLEEMGARIWITQSEENIVDQDVIVYSSAVKESNPEYLAAKKMGCQLIHRSQLLAYLAREQKGLAICGTHGKTTTTALLTHIFQTAAKDPSFMIGGEFQGVNGYTGSGEHFIFEADESDGTFLEYEPRGVLLTSLELDHVDFYHSEEVLKERFCTFLNKLSPSSPFFYYGEDSLMKEVVGEKGVSYGFSTSCEARLSSFQQTSWHITFDLEYNGKLYEKIEVSGPGKHLALNAAGAFLLALSEGLEERFIRLALKSFKGVKRRVEKKREDTVLYLDDYAHHPKEVSVTLDGIKKAVKDRRVVVLFQPHRFSRTKTFLDEFATSFEKADLVLITDIYSAGEENATQIHSKDLVRAIEEKSTAVVHYIPETHLKEKVLSILRPHDVFVTMGAGSVTSFHEQIPSDFRPLPWRVALFFGGQSTEHHISIITARFLKSALESSGAQVSLVPISLKGEWMIDQEASQDYLNEEGYPGFFHSPLSSGVLSFLEQIDLCMPCFHGPRGEDGTFHALFELLGKGCIGTTPLSGGICMHKETAKRMALAVGVSTPPWIGLKKFEWESERSTFVEKISNELKYPVFVKPMRLGSSIGVSKVSSNEQLEKAIDLAFCLEYEVLVEQGVVGGREVEFPIIGNSALGEVEVPCPGEKLSGGEFVDYEKKYQAGKMSSTIEPSFTKEELKSGREAARKLYLAFQCHGFTRIDFMLDKNGQWWFFDANPIPGMNPLSISPKVWKREGYSLEQLGKKFIQLALEKMRADQRYLLRPLKALG
jgi:UDP-N-acetylmuramate--alanine ligase